MTICPKCGGASIAGPFYEKEVGGESLRYRCIRCGYTCHKPTLDARKRGDLPKAWHK